MVWFWIQIIWPYPIHRSKSGNLVVKMTVYCLKWLKGEVKLVFFTYWSRIQIQNLSLFYILVIWIPNIDFQGKLFTSIIKNDSVGQMLKLGSPCSICWCFSLMHFYCVNFFVGGSYSRSPHFTPLLGSGSGGYKGRSRYQGAVIKAGVATKERL